MNAWRLRFKRMHVLRAALLIALSVSGSLFWFASRVSTAYADGNLVQNPGFEDSTNGWYAWAGGASTTTSTAHGGSASLGIGTGMGGEAQSLTLQPNTIYSLAGWGKTSGTGEFSQITLRIVDGSNNEVDYQMPFTMTDWTRQARTITTPATISSAIVYIMKNAGSGYFYADDILVAPGRDVEAWPFAQNSIWNTPLGSNAQYTSVPFHLEQSYIYDGEPLVYADANAPWRNAYTPGSTSANDFGNCNLDPSQGSVGSPQGQLQLPDSYIIDNATRSPNFTPNNASLEIQGNGRVGAQFQPTARCSAGGGIFGYRATDLDLYGPGINGGHYGSGLSSTGGGIKPGELIGPGAIGHALQLEFWMEKNASNNPGFRWPSNNADYNAAADYCSQDPCKSNPSAFASFEEGSLLAIPPSVTAQSLGITTAPGLKIFNALQNYGGYIVDDTGWSNQSIGADYQVDAEMQNTYGYGFNTSSSATGAALQWYNDLNSIFSNLQVVDNNGPSSIGGGGTPRASLAPDFDVPPPAEPTALDRSNWSATASLNNGSIGQILDGNPGTYWNSGQAQASGQNFVIDMQSPQTFNEVSLDGTADFANYAQNYEIDVSNDGSSWTQVFGGTGCGSGPSLATFPGQTARYLRVQLTGGSLTGHSSWSVGEVNVYNDTSGSNALNRSGWKVSGSPTASGNPASNAIDGNLTTSWSTGQAQANGDVFQIDLGSTQSFSKIVLDASHDPNNYPRGYLVFVSNSSGSWGNVVAACDNCNSNAVQTYTFTTQTGRYITIDETQSNSNPWSIDEINIYP